MTVAEFRNWQPEVFPGRRWQLIDGTPACMSPPSPDHGRLIGELTFLLKTHLNAMMPGCDVLVGVGVVPAVNPTRNERIPDILVTCEPASNTSSVTSPIVIAEILSPSNADITRNNFELYKTIPSVQEILLLESLKIKAALTRRQQDGEWPTVPINLESGSQLGLDSIGFTTPLAKIYRLTSLASSDEP